MCGTRLDFISLCQVSQLPGAAYRSSALASGIQPPCPSIGTCRPAAAALFAPPAPASLRRGAALALEDGAVDGETADTSTESFAATETWQDEEQPAAVPPGQPSPPRDVPDESDSTEPLPAVINSTTHKVPYQKLKRLCENPRRSADFPDLKKMFADPVSSNAVLRKWVESGQNAAACQAHCEMLVTSEAENKKVMEPLTIKEMRAKGISEPLGCTGKT